jgi:hypothetical protein
MPQKLAIAISGAVSLGSYESGVMYEVIEAIAQHNENLDRDATLSEQERAQKKVVIDVITGASAGAMTACILAQKLLFDADALRDPYKNDLYHPWVEDVDIQKLLKMQADDKPDLSIFSSALIAEIGQSYVLRRYATGAPTQRKRHPASAASIRLGLAMSNLNGFDYQVPVSDFSIVSDPVQPTQSNFTYTCHKDHLVREIHATAQDDNEQLWKNLELKARSSGAFPFAFRVLEIDRQPDEDIFDDPHLSPLSSYSFAYTDGGVFENEPLGMAKRLVNQIDQDHLHHDNRFYLYVSPGAKTSTRNQKFSAGTATYINTAVALMEAIFTQARFQDWIATSQINEAVHSFDAQAIGLKHFFSQKFSQPAASDEDKRSFRTVAEELLNALYTGQSQQQVEDNNRLKQQFSQEYSELATDLGRSGVNGEEVAETWLKAVQALEKAADLGEKDVMRVYAITSQDQELAGEKLYAFGGFFQQSFRDFDYKVGRRKATHFLQELQALHQQGKGEGQLYLTHFVAGQNLPDKPDLSNVSLRDVPRPIRIAVKNQLIDRLKRIVQLLEMRFWVRWLLQLSLWLFFSKQLNKILELE